MSIDIDGLKELCADLGMKCCSPGKNRLDIELSPEVVLCFENLPEEDDTLVGFRDTPWHYHDILMVMTGEATCLDCDEFDVLRLLSCGDLLIVTRIVESCVNDRWLSHRLEKQDFQYLDVGEEIHVTKWHNKSE